MHTQASIAPQATRLGRALLAACIGNALEWFDVAIYSFFSSYIAHNFFPSDNSQLSLIITFGTFAVSFLIRPIGAIILGAYADTHGRKSALLVSLGLMMLSLFMIVATPPFSILGIWAPLLIILARLIQGFSAGGEYGSSTALLVELFPEQRRFIASWQFTTQGISVLMAAAFGFTLTQLMSEATLIEWGWRIPFIFGLTIGPIGLLIRRAIQEPDAAQAPVPTAPIGTLLGNGKLLIVIAGGMLAISTAINYLLQYMPSYAKGSLHLTSQSGYAGSLIAGLVLALITPFAGLLAERVGRPPLVITALALFILTILPCFLLLNSYPSTQLLMIILGWLALLKALYFATVPSLMADLFPREIRASGMSIAYNLSVTLFGGFTPLIASSTVALTGSGVSPAVYLMLLAIFSAVCIYGFYRKVPSADR